MNGPSLNQTTPIKCENCGNEIFIPAYILRRVSKILIASQDDGIIPINTFACAKCGHTNKEFLPEELEAETPKEEPKSNIIL